MKDNYPSFLETIIVKLATYKMIFDDDKYNSLLLEFAEKEILTVNRIERWKDIWWKYIERNRSNQVKGK